MKQLLSVMLATILAACGVVKENNNSNALLMLSPGYTKERVMELTGPPAKREVYGSNEYWLYKTDVASTEMARSRPF